MPCTAHMPRTDYHWSSGQPTSSVFKSSCSSSTFATGLETKFKKVCQYNDEIEVPEGGVEPTTEKSFIYNTNCKSIHYSRQSHLE